MYLLSASRRAAFSGYSCSFRSETRGPTRVSTTPPTAGQPSQTPPGVRPGHDRQRKDRRRHPARSGSPPWAATKVHLPPGALACRAALALSKLCFQHRVQLGGGVSLFWQRAAFSAASNFFVVHSPAPPFPAQHLFCPVQLAFPTVPTGSFSMAAMASSGTPPHRPIARRNPVFQRQEVHRRPQGGVFRAAQGRVSLSSPAAEAPARPRHPAPGGCAMAARRCLARFVLPDPARHAVKQRRGFARPFSGAAPATAKGLLVQVLRVRSEPCEPAAVAVDFGSSSGPTRPDTSDACMRFNPSVCDVGLPLCTVITSRAAQVPVF